MGYSERSYFERVGVMVTAYEDWIAADPQVTVVDIV
jgi:hypothetical protein